MPILQEIFALHHEFTQHLPFETVDNIPNRLEVPQCRLQELADALEASVEYKPANAPKVRFEPKKENATGPNMEKLKFMGMEVVVGSKLQVWRVDIKNDAKGLK